MCLSCGCNEPMNSHDDIRNITMLGLRGAAEAAGTTPNHAASNILTALRISASDSETWKASSLLDWSVLKTVNEKRYTLGLAYPAMRPDPAKAADNHRDFVSEEVLEKTAWEWMVQHRDINLFHQDGTSGHGTVVESYIYRGPDWEVVSPVNNKGYTIRSGDWLLGAVWDVYGWTLVKAGYINGWSPEGTARRSWPSIERLSQLRS